MKTIAGSVLILSGAVLFAGGTIADATLAAASRLGNAGGLSLLGGCVLALIGFALLGIGLKSDCSPPARAPG